MLFSTIWKALALLPAAGLVNADQVAHEEQRIMGPACNEMKKIREKLQESKIIPDVIDDFTPILELRVAWKHVNASLGNELRPRRIQTTPSVHLDTAGAELATDIMADSGLAYVVVMTDPDAPSRKDPKWSEFCHWIRVSYQAIDQVTGRRRKDLVEYTPPSPPPGTGPHRYVFLAFVAANGTRKKLHLTLPSGRVRWGSDTPRTGVRDWANENGLAPIAANFFYAEDRLQ